MKKQRIISFIPEHIQLEILAAVMQQKRQNILSGNSLSKRNRLTKMFYCVSTVSIIHKIFIHWWKAAMAILYFHGIISRP